jgi:DNA repair protein RecN (Recombination protein N)
VLRRLRIENLVLIRDAELDFGSGLTVLTGETGAGKTIFAQAIGLLLGAKGDVSAVGPDGEEAYVEAEFDVREELFEEPELAPLAELRPTDEAGLVLARRVFADGRTRAYAWGRAVAREDVATAAESLIAMSGQFEQRRLARPAYQLDVVDAFAGPAQQAARARARSAWRALADARRRHEELTRDAGAARARLEELASLVEDTGGFEHGVEERLRAERERIRRVAELGEAVAAAATALAPEDGAGASELAAAAERAVAPLERVAPELADIGEELRDLVVRLREVAGDLNRFASSLEAEPDRQEEVEEALERIAAARRRYRCQTLDELLARRAEAEAELAGLADGRDPEEAAREELEAAEQEMVRIASELRAARRERVDELAAAVVSELRDVGMGEAEFVVELRERELGPTGSDEARFLLRANQGLPLAPVAETASGGELSRIALAIAAVGGGATMVFDEVDAGIGGETAHKVADVLRRLSERSQVLVITHLPQIASRADAHISVTKLPGDPTHTRLEPLGEGERQAELERMLGGEAFLTAIAGRR